jgi:hypothetical protein
MSSQQSFETRLNRFKNGVTLIGGWLDYGTNNNKIKHVSLTAFITSVETANGNVDADETDLGNKQSARMALTYTLPEDANPNCLQRRIKGIRNYVKGEELSEGVVRALDKILKKIEPVYPRKKEGEEEAKKKPSPSEKSFAAAVGYGRTVIKLITGLGLPYSPPDSNLTIANMTTLVDDIEDANEDVQKALEKYGKSNRVRKALYDNSVDGMKVRETAILSYLASFPKLKKSEHYIEFRDALRGL